MVESEKALNVGGGGALARPCCFPYRLLQEDPVVRKDVCTPKAHEPGWWIEVG